MAATPSLSIIVVCRNPGARLAVTLDSVWQQKWIEPELIVIDGGSTDGTREWLEARHKQLRHVASEAESGVFQMMNRGLAIASGDWVLFLGSRDRLVGDMVLSETLNWMKKTEAGVVAGETASDDGRIWKLRSRVNPIARNFVPPSATFYRRSLFEENGPFDLTLSSMADYDFNLRLWKNRVRFKPIPLRVAAGSGRRPLSWPACVEEIRARHRYFAAWRSAWWDLRSLLSCCLTSVLTRSSEH